MLFAPGWQCVFWPTIWKACLQIQTARWEVSSEPFAGIRLSGLVEGLLGKQVYLTLSNVSGLMCRG